MSSDSEKREAMLPYFRKMRRNYHTRLLRAEAIKIFADGVIKTKTAALLNPYIGTKNESGDPIYSQDSLNSFVRALDKSGFQVHVYAVGDRAIHMPLDAFEDAINVNGSR